MRDDAMREASEYGSAVWRWVKTRVWLVLLRLWKINHSLDAPYQRSSRVRKRGEMMNEADVYSTLERPGLILSRPLWSSVFYEYENSIPRQRQTIEHRILEL